MSARERVHWEATRLSIEAIAGYLQALLGQRLTAYAVGVRDPKAIGRYARGDAKPRQDTERRLRELLQVAQILDSESEETVRAWMIGSNPLLDDNAPIEELHEGAIRRASRTASADADSATPSAYRPVRAAAEAFAASRVGDLARS